MESLVIPTAFDGTLLLDGNNVIINRLQCNPNGLVVRELLTEINSLKTPPVFVFDGFGGNDRRKAIFPNYKVKTAQELAYKNQAFPTLDLFRRLIPFTQAVVIRVPGWEADDAIATIAWQNASEGTPVHIVSTDRDLSQLAVHHKITVAHLHKHAGPDTVRLYKTFVGDTSDKIGGIPGFGPKSWDLLNKARCQSILEKSADFSHFSEQDLGVKPKIYEWIIHNQVLLGVYWNITGLYTVPMPEITSNIVVGSSQWAPIEAELRKYFL